MIPDELRDGKVREYTRSVIPVPDLPECHLGPADPEQPTRKEEDYLEHIDGVVSLNATDKHIFLNDNLNTHKSESLVRYIAGIESRSSSGIIRDGIDQSTLGVKDKSGILKNMASRSEFLSDKSHQVVFVSSLRSRMTLRETRNTQTLLLAKPSRMSSGRMLVQYYYPAAFE